MCQEKLLGRVAGSPLLWFSVGPAGLVDEARMGRTSEVSMRRIHADASRNMARALDAAHLRSTFEGCGSFETKGQWLPSQLEPPM